MIKQEEMREGINWLVAHAKPEEGQTVGGILMAYLHSKGVGIRGRLLNFEGDIVGYEVEPLIGGKNETNRSTD